MLWQDIRYGLRSVHRAPAFAATAALTLAIGLGLNGALFTVFNTFVLQPIAAQDPQSLYEIRWHVGRTTKRTFSREQYEAIRTQAPVFSGVVADQGFGARLEGRFSFGLLVSGNYFTTLGVNPIIGRAIGPADAQTPGGDRVVVLSYRAAKRLYGGPEGAPGRSVVINGQSFTVLGVCPPEFTGLTGNAVDFFAPLTMSDLFVGGGVDIRGRETIRLRVVGRLTPGVTLERATGALSVLAKNATAELPESQRADKASLESRATQHQLPASALRALSPLLFAFLLVLFICCVNVSSMLLARALGRQKEIGVRLAIGASRSRLVRQLVSEGLVLGVLGGLVGLGVTFATTGGLQSLLLSTLPVSISGNIPIAPFLVDHRVAVFVFVAAALSVFLFALAPALQATNIDLVGALRGEFSRRLRASTLRSFLVSAQIAVCLILVVLTGILIRNSASYQQTDVGFEMRRIGYPLLFGGWTKPESARVVRTLQAEPTVESIAFVLNPPFEGKRRHPVLPTPGSAPIHAAFNLVSPGYFEMLRLPILRGRGFTAEEARSEAAVAIVSQATAASFWPNSDPIGKTIRFAPATSAAPFRFDQAVVIGVAKDVVSGLVYEGPDPTMLYFPASLEASAPVVALVRFKPGPGSHSALLEKLCVSALPGRAIIGMSLEDMFALQVYPLRAASWITSLLGVIALLLTASAMYGVMGYVVNQRIKEVGIRMALGATSANIVEFFLRHCLRLAAGGLTVGVAVSIGLSKVIASLLTAIHTFDAIAYAAGLAVVLLTGVCAAYVPIRRIARANSIDAIRQEG